MHDEHECAEDLEREGDDLEHDDGVDHDIASEDPVDLSMAAQGRGKAKAKAKSKAKPKPRPLAASRLVLLVVEVCFAPVLLLQLRAEPLRRSGSAHGTSLTQCHTSVSVSRCLRTRPSAL